MGSEKPIAVAVSTLLLACGSGATPAALTPSQSSPELGACLAPEHSARPLAAAADGWPSQRCIERAEELVEDMSLAEKAGQMMQPDLYQVRDWNQVRRLALGSVLSGGNSDPKTNDAIAWLNRVAEIRHGSLTSRQAIPLLYAVDAVHGHNNVEGAVIFPHNIGLGCTRDRPLVEQVGRVTAREIAATGIDWTFSPVIAVARDERWGRTYESFGETPELVAELGAALIRGLQGDRPGGAEPSVLACAKHFVADGGTAGGDDQGHTRVDDTTLRAIHLSPYVAAVEANVGTVMASFSTVNGVRMHCHGPLLTDVLKNELGFPGFVVSDWRGVEQISGDDFPRGLAASINAGVDMFMASQQHDLFPEVVQRLVEDQRVPEQRIEDAVRRILVTKCELGLFTAGRFAADPDGRVAVDQRLFRALGSADHRAVARRAVRESLVVLKNDHSVLPLSQDLERVHVVGELAQDLGSQCGGWTISWQGSRGRPTVGTTILEGIREAAGYRARVTHGLGAAGAQGADATIVVIGEAQPYAEGEGDRSDLNVSEADRELVANAARAGAPVVVVLITGRPLVLGDVLEHADAVVVAWLPGTEGGGVGDVIFGESGATGKLGHSWPRSMAQIPINVGDAGYDPLFPYGFGIAYPGRAPEAPPQNVDAATQDPHLGGGPAPRQ